MIPTLKLTLIAVLLSLSAAAQTTITYTLPAGAQPACSSTFTTPTVAETCLNYQTLIGSDGSNGYFQCCNVGATGFISATQYYCGNPYYPIYGGTAGTWTITQLGGTTYSFSFSCETPTSPGPSTTVALTYTATSSVEIVTRYRSRIAVTVWTVDPGSVQLTITPVS